MSGIDLTLDDLKGQLNDLRLRFTQDRKKGLDVIIAHLKFMGIPPKIGIVSATQSYDDLKKLISEIEEVKKELEEVEKGAQFPHTLNQSPSLGEKEGELAKIKALLLDSDLAISNKDFARMAKANEEVNQLYPRAPDEMKKEMYKKTLEINELLKK